MKQPFAITTFLHSLHPNVKWLCFTLLLTITFQCVRMLGGHSGTYLIKSAKLITGLLFMAYMYKELIRNHRIYDR